MDSIFFPPEWRVLGWAVFIVRRELHSDTVHKTGAKSYYFFFLRKNITIKLLLLLLYYLMLFTRGRVYYNSKSDLWSRPSRATRDGYAGGKIIIIAVRARGLFRNTYYISCGELVLCEFLTLYNRTHINILLMYDVINAGNIIVLKCVRNDFRK